jgi:multidrug transporter EmrE-like cation transporter
MTKAIWLLIISNVLLTSVAQIVLKAGMSQPAVLQGLDDGLRSSTVVTVATSPMVVLGLGMYFCAAFIWLLVLARIEVSLAYPFVGIGFVITMLLGWGIHGDSLSVARVAGTLLIAIGVAILARS